MKKCMYCGKDERFKKMVKIHEWNKPEKFAWYCEDHYKQVENFQNKEKKEFLEHFKNPKLREKHLSERQRTLYDRLNKK